MHTTQQKIHSRASFYIIVIILWEFFSYYGMQSIFIVYLTKRLHFSDTHAYTLFGNFTSFIYLAPIIGGWLADRYYGYHRPLLAGCILITFGLFIISFPFISALYWGMSCLIMGTGLFKSNAVCLIGACYPNNLVGKARAFSWYYISANIGTIASTLLCPLIAEQWGWAAGFSLAAFGMLMGLFILIYVKDHFYWYHEVNQSLRKPAKHLTKKLWVNWMLFSIILFMVRSVLIFNWVGYLLIISSFISALLFIKIYWKSDPKKRVALRLLFFLTFFVMIFWIVDQQEPGSLNLFIQRYVDRQAFGLTIPAGMFQSISPVFSLLVGILVASLWQQLHKKGIALSSIFKVAIGFVLLTFAFFFFALSAKIACTHGTSPIYWVVVGLLAIGSAEIFIDPVLFATITEVAPPNTAGQLSAIYYLITGAFTNYLAAQFAILMIDSKMGRANVSAYANMYIKTIDILLVVILLLIIWGVIRTMRK